MFEKIKHLFCPKKEEKLAEWICPYSDCRWKIKQKHDEAGIRFHQRTWIHIKKHLRKEGDT